SLRRTISTTHSSRFARLAYELFTLPSVRELSALSSQLFALSSQLLALSSLLFALSSQLLALC
ncbi:MAG: hypothetical protein KKD12_07735, partial [Proteobacteria bacterium]|nr:hypothetical protein [Pseudomonadota bacterium]